MTVPQSKPGCTLAVLYLVLAAYFITQAFTCVEWMCDLVELPITIPFGLLFLAILHWLDPVFFFGSITYAPFRNWFFIVPTVAVNALIYYWLGIGIDKIISRFWRRKS
jgi:hypothetical protein